MNRTFIWFCLLVPALLQAQVTFHAGDLMTIVKAEQDAYAGKLFQRDPSNTDNYDVQWYKCNWNIDPPVREISGSVTTLFIPGMPGIDTLILDMNDALLVDSVVYHDNPVPWDHELNILTIRFPVTVQQNVADSVTVYYHGVPPDNGFGAFTQSTHDGTPVVWTLSEPYGSSDWWPCKNGLTDKADSIDIYITTPLAYKGVSNGLLVSEQQVGKNIIWHWKHRYPIATYLICIAVTNYAHYLDQVPFGTDTLRVDNYIYPEDSASVAAQTGIIVPMIQLFDTLFGVYPFQLEKYGHAQFGWGGGMEHQTMTFVSSFGFELLAHELAHQWFGDKITCGSWADIWLNEGFATYLSGLCYEHLAPVYWERFREVRVNSIIAYPDGSVFCTDTTSVSRIFDGRLSYAKGAMILHQLRWIFGDTIFYTALKNYLFDESLAYGFARTDQFKSHFENVCGQDLTWYFDDWFTGEGFPSYQINWGQTGDTVSFTVHQTQSHPSVAFFEMTIPVQFKNTSRDTILRFSNTFSGQTYSVAIPFPVDSLKLDPGYQLISGSNTINALEEHRSTNDLRVYPNPANDHLTFLMNGSRYDDNAELSVYDHSGRLLEVLRRSPGETGMILQTLEYFPGLYFYLLTRQNSQFRGKFIIVR